MKRDVYKHINSIIVCLGNRNFFINHTLVASKKSTAYNRYVDDIDPAIKKKDSSVSYEFLFFNWNISVINFPLAGISWPFCSTTSFHFRKHRSVIKCELYKETQRLPSLLSRNSMGLILASNKGNFISCFSDVFNCWLLTKNNFYWHF